MKRIVYFHRNIDCGYSINKVTQTIISQFSNKAEFFMPQRRSGILDVIKNIIFIIKNRQRQFINHITGDIHYGIIGLIGYKSVLTIHDTVFVDFNKGVKRLIFEWLWFKVPLKFATKVVCISDTTKRSIERFTNRHDIRVIHNAIDDSIQFKSREFELKDCYNVLIIGTAPNKNLPITFRALKGLPIKLTIIGKLNDEQSKCLLDNNVDYISVVGVSDSDINRYYGESDLVCFCSLFEGFGMIVLEANQSGCPIVCSDIPVLHEVGAEAAYYVDPHDCQSIHNGIKYLLEHPEERFNLVKKGRDNIKRFNPSFIREQWISLYNDML